MISLVLADDHPIVLAGLSHLFEAERDFLIVARCASGEQALAAVRQHQPDVLVMDLRMPDKNGIDVLRELHAENLRTRAVLVTAGLNEDELLDAMRFGVKGVVLKEMAPRLLLQCVRKVHAGGEWLEQRLAGRAIDKLLRADASERAVSALLTPRELAVARLVSQGKRNREIAEALGITEGTVKMHMHNIFDKAGVTNRLELSLFMRERGLT